MTCSCQCCPVLFIREAYAEWECNHKGPGAARFWAVRQFHRRKSKEVIGLVNAVAALDDEPCPKGQSWYVKECGHVYRHTSSTSDLTAQQVHASA
jgi:hypothetical protein